MAWDVKRDVLNKSTGLSIVTATRTNVDSSDVHVYKLKAIMKTKVDQDRVWSEIYQMYQIETIVEPDAVAAAGKAALEAKEVV